MKLLTEGQAGWVVADEGNAAFALEFEFVGVRINGLIAGSHGTFSKAEEGAPYAYVCYASKEAMQEERATQAAAAKAKAKARARAKARAKAKADLERVRADARARAGIPPIAKGHH